MYMGICNNEKPILEQFVYFWVSWLREDTTIDIWTDRSTVHAFQYPAFARKSGESWPENSNRNSTKSEIMFNKIAKNGIEITVVGFQNANVFNL